MSMMLPPNIANALPTSRMRKHIRGPHRGEPEVFGITTDARKENR